MKFFFPFSYRNDFMKMQSLLLNLPHLNAMTYYRALHPKREDVIWMLIEYVSAMQVTTLFVFKNTLGQMLFFFFAS